MVYIPAGAFSRLPRFWRRFTGGMYSFLTGAIVVIFLPIAFVQNQFGYWAMATLFVITFLVMVAMWISDHQKGVSWWPAYVSSAVAASCVLAAMAIIVTENEDEAANIMWGALIVGLISFVFRIGYGIKLTQEMKRKGLYNADRRASSRS